MRGCRVNEEKASQRPGERHTASPDVIKSSNRPVVGANAAASPLRPVDDVASLSRRNDPGEVEGERRTNELNIDINLASVSLPSHPSLPSRHC